MLKLTKNEFEYLYSLYKKTPFAKTEQIDVIIKRLTELNLIDNSNILTENGLNELKNYKIENAIILAAGTSSRFVPICFDKPKGLLYINGEVLIERQIKQLKEIGINDISIIVGFKKEMFEYLKDKYNVKLIVNPEYDTKNNYSSVYIAKDILKNTIITSSDLYFTNNIFETHAYDAFYCSIYKDGYTEERGLFTDENDKIIKTSYNVHDIWVSLGYAYFSKRFSDNFIKIVDKINDLPETRNKFWADIQDEYLDDLFMYIKKCTSSDIHEFDSLAELRLFDKNFNAYNESKTMQLICKSLNCEDRDLTQFTPVDMTGRVKVCTFKLKNNQYKYVFDTQTNISEIVDITKEEELQANPKRTIIRKKMGELKHIINSFNNDQTTTLPLCAAENVMSEFCKIPLNSNFQERYIMGSSHKYDISDNFIGSEYLFPFYEKITQECSELYHCKYADARTLTGMNCLTMLAMSLTHAGENIMILGKEYGGHASVAPILERLGLNVFTAPYILENYDFDYEKLNKEVKDKNIKYILLAPSDILFPFDLTKIDDSNTILLYDASQILGMIAAGLMENPLEKMTNIVMFGGTHKTIPGPAHGLILTNNKELFDIIDAGVNPKYLRNTQMHQVISLLFTLIEMQYFGKDYQANTVRMANLLGKYLEAEGLNVVSKNGIYTKTHELFIEYPKEQMDIIFKNAVKERITLNTKKKPLFHGGYGIRLGLQEISRYAWDDKSIFNIAKIIKFISEEHYDSAMVKQLIETMPPKKIHYTFDDEEITDILQACNNNIIIKE